jgi:hypothetical protein
MNKKQPIQNRIEKNYMPVTECGCWIWTGGLDKDGYGKICIDGMNQRAHRVSFELHREKIPDGECALHTCDIRCCINPDHIFIGTRADNMTDKCAKDRQPNGERHYRSRLSEDDVILIRSSSISNKEAAAAFGVTYKAIWRIRKREVWKHI